MRTFRRSANRNYTCRKVPRPIQLRTQIGWTLRQMKWLRLVAAIFAMLQKHWSLPDEFFEAEVRQLQAAVSNGYLRGKFVPVSRDHKDWYD